MYGQVDQFGVQQRAESARRMIVLAVQQAISSLPPASGQSFAYRFDPASDTYVVNTHLGPTALRVPDTLGAGNISLRTAASYFDLDDTLGPIDYLFEGITQPGTGAPFGTRFGLETGARVGVISLAGSYGVTSVIQLDLTLPIVITRTHGEELYISQKGFDEADAVPLRPEGNIDSLLAKGDLDLRRASFRTLGAEFNDGTQAGIGRINLTAKAVYDATRFQLAFAPELLFPSPHEDQFAGSASVAVLPRAIASAPLGEIARVLADVGYEYDFDVSELRRFVWDIGLSIGGSRYAFDLGFGGSQYAEGIEWTPQQATFVDFDGNTQTITALGDNRLGTTLVSFLGGIKVRLTDALVVSGTVSVPVTGTGFEPAAMGTLGLEYYLWRGGGTKP